MKLKLINLKKCRRNNDETEPKSLKQFSTRRIKINLDEDFIYTHKFSWNLNRRRNENKTEKIVDSKEKQPLKKRVRNTKQSNEEIKKRRKLNNLISNPTRQKPLVAKCYQAVVPPKITEEPYLTDNQDELLWHPDMLPEEEVEKFLTQTTKKTMALNQNVVIDNEAALLMLHKCNYNVNIAQKKIKYRKNRTSEIIWTKEEAREFNSALKMYGKDFDKIQKHVETKTLREVIHYYYAWKKKNFNKVRGCRIVFA